MIVRKSTFVYDNDDVKCLYFSGYMSFANVSQEKHKLITLVPLYNAW